MSKEANNTKTLTNHPTTHKKLLTWVEQITQLTQPKNICWVSGTKQQQQQILTQLTQKGILKKLNEKLYPNSYLANSDESDVARVESRTFICSEKKIDAGFTNNWVDPKKMKQEMLTHYKNCMNGRTMYIIPFVMGHLNAPNPKFGVEITDSEYVVASMYIMSRIGNKVLKTMTQNNSEFVAALHSVGAPLQKNQTDTKWSCNKTKYITHFPEEKTIWSYGSGYGGNALLGKKCYALRIASKIAQEEGWLAEHMLILKLTNPENKTHYIAAAFPSACGKTNLAMLQPKLPGWKVETLGDDIAWLNFDKTGQLRATNPETGFFGVAPGTNWHTNPNAMETIKTGNSIFTNVALTAEGGIWWEGMTKTPPKQLTNWLEQPWSPNQQTPASHPNSRFCTPIEQCPTTATEYYDPQGVPISAILFGGRRKNTIPLVTQSYNWQHGVFMGATLSSETTAAAEGQTGIVRRDPMAMLPFIGYNAGDYLQHWINLETKNNPKKMPQIFYVNWFRKNLEGKFLWPGFNENIRVLKWVFDRLENKTTAHKTPIGFVPTPNSLDTSSLNLPKKYLTELLEINPQQWENEIIDIKIWFKKFGQHLPQALKKQLTLLEQNFQQNKKT